jgi:hypothetical protein
MLAGLDVKVMFILDDGCVGFIFFPHWKSSKIHVLSAVFEAILHTKLLKKEARVRFRSLHAQFSRYFSLDSVSSKMNRSSMVVFSAWAI